MPNYGEGPANLELGIPILDNMNDNMDFVMSFFAYTPSDNMIRGISSNRFHNY